MLKTPSVTTSLRRIVEAASAPASVSRSEWG